MQQIFFRLIVLPSICFFLPNLSIFAQVNTEDMRKYDLSDGLYNSLQVDFGLVSGNSDFLKLKSSIRADFVSGKYYTFGVIQYQRGIQDDNLFINKAFGHLRGIQRLTRIFFGELFVQKEFNDFILLKDRNLIGGGLRTAVLFPYSTNECSHSIYCYIGNGLMWENEEIDTRPVSETKIFRSTNYISLRWQLDDRVDLAIVTYYQFHLSNLHDYRILFQSGLGFNITKSLAFKTSLNLRYDNEPPSNIKKYDLEINNGLRFDF